MNAHETGKTNAFRFVNAVLKASREGRVVQLYASDWPWMKNGEWRAFVLEQLTDRVKVRSAQFHKADAVDAACFTAISCAGESQIDKLTLDDTIEGFTPPKRGWARFKWMFMSFVPGLSVQEWT